MKKINFLLLFYNFFKKREILVKISFIFLNIQLFFTYFYSFVLNIFLGLVIHNFYCNNLEIHLNELKLF